MTTIESSRLLRERDVARQGFSLSDKPGLLTVLFEGQPIIRFVNEHVYNRVFRIEDLRLRPGGPIEMPWIVTSTVFPMLDLLACRWDYRVSENQVEIGLEPSKLDGNPELPKLVTERRTFLIKYLPEKDRFLYEIRADLHFLKDIRGTEGLELLAPAQQEGDQFAVIQVDNPMLSGGIGPQVPMTRDWVGANEPVFSPEGYTTAWRKRYFSVTIDTVKRGVRKIMFNRMVNTVQKFYNRTLPVTKPKRPIIYTRDDGHAIRVTPTYDHFASHHICEWGYDQHYYALMPRASAELLFKAGQRLSLAFTLEEIDADEIPAEYVKAPLAEIEPEERAAADMPMYEEPVCKFTESTLDHPDTYGWRHSGKGFWNRTGGFEKGYGALEIRHGDESGNSAWQFGNWGPSSACNPVPPMSKYEISAWVKAKDLDKVELSMEFAGFAGPAMFSPKTDHPFTDKDRKIVETRGEWVHLSFIAGPTPSLTLYGTFVFRYKSDGVAAISGVRLQRL